MKMSKIYAAIGAFTTTCGLLVAIEQSAVAQTLNRPWQYAIDSFNDGYSFGVVGQNSPFEFYAIAVLQDGDSIFVALNSNMPLSGVVPPDGYEAEGGVVSYGDLLFNFFDEDFNTANAGNRLYGIRFASSNDSKVPTLGVYNNVNAISVTSTNLGFASLNNYNSIVQSVGGTVTYGDFPVDTAYFDPTSPVFNVIGSGNFVAPIQEVGLTQLQELGLDFDQFGATGSQTIGFSFSKEEANLPTGGFIASLFAECANDGIVIQGETEDVPEPFSIFSAIAGIGLIWRKRRNKRKQAASLH